MQGFDVHVIEMYFSYSLPVLTRYSLVLLSVLFPTWFLNANWVHTKHRNISMRLLEKRNRGGGERGA